MAANTASIPPARWMCSLVLVDLRQPFQHNAAVVLHPLCTRMPAHGRQHGLDPARTLDVLPTLVVVRQDCQRTAATHLNRF